MIDPGYVPGGDGGNAFTSQALIPKGVVDGQEIASANTDAEIEVRIIRTISTIAALRVDRTAADSVEQTRVFFILAGVFGKIRKISDITNLDACFSIELLYRNDAIRICQFLKVSYTAPSGKQNDVWVEIHSEPLTEHPVYDQAYSNLDAEVDYLNDSLRRVLQIKTA